MSGKHDGLWFCSRPELGAGSALTVTISHINISLHESVCGSTHAGRSLDVCNTGTCASPTLRVPTGVSAADLGHSWPRARSAPGAGALLLPAQAAGAPETFPQQII